MKNTIRRLALVIAVAAITAGLAASAAQACGNTRSNDQPTHYFDGMEEISFTSGSPFSCYFGVETPSLYDTNPSVLSPDGGGEFSTSSAWVGLTFYDSTTNYVLAQDGFMKFYNGNYNYFNEINVNNHSWKDGEYGNPGVGLYHDFKVTFTYATNTFNYFWNGALQYQWHYTGDQLGCNWTTEGEAQGEITSAHNQMPGTQVNPETISDVQVMSNGGAWASGTGWLGDDDNNSWFYNAISYDTHTGGPPYYASSRFYDNCN